MRQGELEQELLTSQTDHAATKEDNRSLKQQLSSALASKASLELELQQKRNANEQLDRELDRTREALGTTRQALEHASKELESTRQVLEAERLEFESGRQRLSATIAGLEASREAAEVRHRHETAELSSKLDQARMKSDQLRNNIEALRDAAASANELHRIEEVKLQGENGNLRQQVGVLEGKLQGISAHRDELSKELQNLRNHQYELNVEVGAARSEAEIWKQKAQVSEGKLAELSAHRGTHSDDSSLGAV
jgi:chromosome segregation ATPase